MKIFIAQQNYHIGNFAYNTKKIISAILQAKEAGNDLVVFSELCICGYPPRDFLYFNDFIDKCENSINEIKQYADGIAVLIGAPQKNNIVSGKDLYNSAYFLENKEIKTIIQKTCLPTYDVFDEDRYFEPANTWNIIEFNSWRLAVTICEDIWNLGNNPLYRYCPMDMLMNDSPDIMINLSASPFDYTHDEDRKAAVKANVLKYNLPMVYCNAVGSQTEVVFDGASLVFDSKANLCGKLASFEEDHQSFEINKDGTVEARVIEPSSSVPDLELNPDELIPDLNIESIYKAIVLGIRDYFAKMNFKKAIIGSSGGIDSAVTLALATDALGAENVIGVLMPSHFSSDHSVADAEQLSVNTGTAKFNIPIESIFNDFSRQLKPVFNEMPFNIAEENIQSRIRGTLLMAIANKFGYILLNTSNKSELATGYGTLYGDMAGGLSVLGDCYKLQVYELAKYINRNNEVIPAHILQKPPSAELRPGQKDSDSLPEYSLLDKILYLYIEKLKGPDEIKKAGYDEAVVDRILQLVNSSEHKRNQFCPIIRVSSKSFGVGRRVPIVAKYLS